MSVSVKRQRSSSTDRAVNVEPRDAYLFKVPLPISSDTDKRLRRFLDYVADAHFLYYVNQVPASATWGTASMSRFLCDPASDTPLRLWLMGSIETVIVTSSGTEPHSKLSLTLAFLRDADREACNALVQLGRPAAELAPHFVASRSSMSSESSGLFTAVYDATGVYTAKRAMQKLDAGCLVHRDVVLVEFFCQRERYMRMRTSSRWTAWNTDFLIESVSLLVRAPRVEYPLVVDSFVGHM